MTQTQTMVAADFRGNKPMGEHEPMPLNLAAVEAFLHQGKRMDPQVLPDVQEVYGEITAMAVEDLSDICTDCGLWFYNPDGADFCEVCEARHEHGFALTARALEMIGAFSPRCDF